jgi:hypothetical protein
MLAGKCQKFGMDGKVFNGLGVFRQVESRKRQRLMFASIEWIPRYIGRIKVR